MYIYLIDPRKKWHKANLHCHTTNSDGFYTPEQIKNIYMKKGYSIVAFSDHNLIYDNSYLCDENFIAITACEYSIDLLSKPANYTYVNHNDNDKVTWRDLKVIHLNMYSKDPHNIFHPACNVKMFDKKTLEKYGKEVKCDGYAREYTKESIQETINRLNDGGFLVQFNHPNWSLNTRDDYIDLKGLWSLEIFNYGGNFETGAEYCINIYDDMLRYGHKICCTMGDDNHNPKGSLDGSFGAFNYIGVDSLSYENVIKAMEEKNIYASTGPIIKALYINKEEKKIYVECSKATDIILVGYNRIFKPCHGNNLTKAEFKINGNEVYFRITVKDKNNRVANTHAYFLEDYGF